MGVPSSFCIAQRTGVEPSAERTTVLGFASVPCQGRCGQRPIRKDALLHARLSINERSAMVSQLRVTSEIPPRGFLAARHAPYFHGGSPLHAGTYPTGRAPSGTECI
jgi:hypothetical protein